MAEQKKMVEAITSMEEDFAKWYTDIVKKAELMDYSSVRGCMIIEPYGWAIWENIRDILDHEFKELGHENVAMPLPLLSGRGFGIKLAYRPFLAAMDFTAALKVKRLSAAVIASLYLKSISFCPGPCS